MANVICKECRFCTWLSYNALGEISIDCKIHCGWGQMIRHEITHCDDFDLPDFDTSCWDADGYFKAEYLSQLRDEVTLGSLFIDDYRNRFGIDPNFLFNFFEAYEIWLDEDFLDDSDEALNEWYEYSVDPITINNLIQKPNQ